MNESNPNADTTNPRQDFFNQAADDFAQPKPDFSHWQPPTAEQLDAQLPDFHVSELIGRGGMGAVYRGTQPSLHHRPVAIKVLPPELAAAPDFAERFEREAAMLAKCDHPHIMPIHAFGETEAGSPYFVMPFMSGGELAAYRVTKGRLSEAEVIDLGAQLLDGVAELHRLGLVHRDLKPSNLFLTETMTLKIGDLGIARYLPGAGPESQLAMTETGLAVGTAAYAAPEQRDPDPKRPVDHQADLYAVGVILYELLTGELPHGLKSPSEVAGCDGRFDALVKRALEADPEARFVTARDMQLWLRGETVSAPDIRIFESRIEVSGVALSRGARVSELEKAIGSRGVLELADYAAVYHWEGTGISVTVARDSAIDNPKIENIHVHGAAYSGVLFYKDTSIPRALDRHSLVEFLERKSLHWEPRYSENQPFYKNAIGNYPERHPESDFSALVNMFTIGVLDRYFDFRWSRKVNEFHRKSALGTAFIFPKNSESDQFDVRIRFFPDRDVPLAGGWKLKNGVFYTRDRFIALSSIQGVETRISFWGRVFQVCGWSYLVAFVTSLGIDFFLGPQVTEDWIPENKGAYLVFGAWMYILSLWAFLHWACGKKLAIHTAAGILRVHGTGTTCNSLREALTELIQERECADFR